jgi:HPt (histidine-containing phosphotransfer) domain-containing protein
VAHRIKSTLLQLGMPALAQTARPLEKEVHTKGAIAVQQQAQQLLKALQVIAKQLS